MKFTRLVATVLLSAVAFLAFSANLDAASVVQSASHAHDSLGGPLMFPVFGVALATGALTLADWAKRLDPDGKVPTIVELLSQTNEILEDMLWKEGNLPTGHRVTVRTGLPTAIWRLLNGGVAPTKSTTAQIDEQAGMLEAWSEVDVDLAALNGNEKSFRLSEAMAFIEAMNQEFAGTLFYGNAGLAPEEFTGLAPRYSDSSATNGSNVIKATAGAGGDNTSMWLVVWGDAISGIFPKGSKAGLIHNDYGEVTVEVTAGVAGNRMRALQERFQWKGGIAVKDWRYAVRIANLDVSDMNGGTTIDIITLMEQALETVPSLTQGKPVFYANRTTRRYLRKFARTAVGNGGGLTFENFAGKRIMQFGDIPVRLSDQILNTETAVP